MATIPIAPPPPPPPFYRFVTTVKSSAPPPPPPPPSRQVSSQLPSPKLTAEYDDATTLADLVNTEVNGTASELVTSSVSTSSPNAEEVPSTPTQPALPSEESTVHSRARGDDDVLDDDPSVAHPAVTPKDEGVLSTSSMTSSPRRPRRAGTGIPENARVSDFDFEVSDDIGPSARDEFEEEFLNRCAADREAQIISDVLERVDFRQLSDDEEILSDDAPDSSREAPACRENECSKQAKQRRRDTVFDVVELRRSQKSTVRSNWRRLPSGVEVGCEECEGCNRLCEENRKLRRQVDELEFELASGVVHNSSDGFDPTELGRAIPAMSENQAVSKKKKGWTHKLRNATALSVTSSKPSERARLKAEVQALSVTTEYLWRKLNKAENELQNYRLQDLRNRMKQSGQQSDDDRDGVRPRERHLDLVGSDDWDWE